ncbi:SAM-dependent methyltransferase [uncultured Rhodospira sp.]|uniref:class I SAM-dependent methyltransferase n=1 Tax=uncultured Rhodospira sp. TaxID=1936189 RepID=UPI00261683E3|nr:SAM-dependent methyltransferase [uncultured Rhodospira sp.]
MSTPVEDRLRARIAAEGPLPVEDVMAEANAAYYARGTAIGAAGDFITAPEISQVFGEVVGLWTAVVWQLLGMPKPVSLVECGPGRGTLMADALRALAPVPAFREALEVHLVETSPALREVQCATLGDAVTAWHDGLETLPDRPLLLIANEFLDALPVRQYVRVGAAWHLRRVDVDADGAFRFVTGEPVAADDLDPRVRARAPDGAIAEVCPAARDVVAAVARRVAARGGAAVFIDYGHAVSAGGDTLQAVRRHAQHPVLQGLGTVDLTAHVDFQALAESAESAGVLSHGPVDQGSWLRALGAEMRAAQLCRHANENQAEAVRSGVRRLIDPGEMGTLFRVFAVTAPGLASPPGFEGT